VTTSETVPRQEDVSVPRRPTLLLVDRENLTSAGRQMKPRPLRSIRRIPRNRTLASYVPESVKTLKHRSTRGLPARELKIDPAAPPARDRTKVRGVLP